MKKLLAMVMCLGLMVFGVAGGAKADLVTFNFNSPGLPNNSNNTQIGTYMTGLYGPTVTVTGHDGPVSEGSGLFSTGYIESENDNIFGSGENQIQIVFATPITSVSFDWARYADPFNADYSLNGTTFTNFFSTGNDWTAGSGHFNTLTFTSPVVALRFHDDGYGEVGIDNLVVNRQAVPEAATMMMLGTGLLGLLGFRRRIKK